MRPQDGTQEMERKRATAKAVAWPSCAWQLLSLFPFPVGHSVAAHGTVNVRVEKSGVRFKDYLFRCCATCSGVVDNKKHSENPVLKTSLHSFFLMPACIVLPLKISENHVLLFFLVPLCLPLKLSDVA